MIMLTDPKRGRPTEYTPGLAAEICRRLAEGETLRAICRDIGMPAESTVRAWAVDDRDGFSAQYTRAREIGYLGMADEVLEIADDSAQDVTERAGADGQAIEVVNHENIQRARLRVDTRK